MARIRSVHPDICASQTLAQLPAHLERTFVRFWTHCDDHGRCEDRPRLIKAGIYPEHDEITWERLDGELWELDAAGLIIRYESGGKAYIAVCSWSEYQHPQKPRPSKFPPPPETDDNGTPDDPSGTATRRVRDTSGNGMGLERERERETGGEKETVTAAPKPSLALVAPDTPSSPTATAPAYPSDFEAFWTLYPRKVAKREASTAWRKARGDANWEAITTGLHRSIAAWEAERRPADKIPHASTWLNGRRWEDDHTAPQVTPAEPKGFAGIRAALSHGNLA